MPRRSALTIPGIYTITNTVTGTVYIGQAHNIRRRWESHRHYLIEGTHYNSYLQRAWAKYGRSSFVFAVLHDLSGTKKEALRDALNLAEVKVIQAYPDIYNVSDGGIVAPIASATTRLIWSAQRKAMWAAEGFRERRSVKIKALYADPVWRAKRDEAVRQGVRTPEARANSSAKFKRLWASDEHRKTQSAKRTANWTNPEYRALQTASRKAAWADPEVRRKRSEGIKAAHARWRALKTLAAD